MSKNNRKKKKAGNKQKNSINKNTINKSQINQPNIQGDNNTTTTNINVDNHVEYNYIYGNPEESSLNNMREGLGKYEGREVKNMEALFIPDLTTTYTISTKNVKGYGKEVKAYTVLNVCSEDGELLSDHSQLEIEGITLNGFKAWPIDTREFTHRIRFSGIVHEYMSGDEKKIGVYITSKPEFLQDKCINIYKSETDVRYSDEIIENIKYDFAEKIGYDEYIEIIYREISYLQQYTNRISSNNFVLNYILSLLLLRSQNSKLSRSDISLLIYKCDKDKPIDLRNICKTLCFVSAYVSKVDFLDLYSMLREITLFIMKIFGIFSITKNNEQDERFNSYINHLYGCKVKVIFNMTFKSCVQEMKKDFKYNQDDLNKDLIDEYPYHDAILHELQQLSCDMRFRENLKAYVID